MDKSEGNQPDSMNPAQNGPPGAGIGSPQPPTPVDDYTAEDDGRFFTPGNLVMIAILLALAGLVASKFNLIEIWAICKAGLGLSFVIFIHELGHFLAAKWCDVNVTTFSIGFGPAIPGCRFQWGETTYKLAILPLGGYVQMVGQVDGDESNDGSEDDPRSYRAKSVWQRMLIISAGVIMNAILAVICFIGVYNGAGKEHLAGVISSIDSKGPGFDSGLRTGSEILQIGAKKNATFNDMMQIVINTDTGEKLPITFKRPDDAEPTTRDLLPRKDENDLRPMIGVLSPAKTKLVDRTETRDTFCAPGTPAAKAGFDFGDVIVGMTDPDHPDQKKGYDPKLVTELRDDPRLPKHGQKDYFEFSKRLQLLADKTIVVRVHRGAKAEVVDLTVAPLFRVDTGAVMKMGPIQAVRADSAAADPTTGVFKSRVVSEKKLEGDLIEGVTIVNENDKKIEYVGATLDPERLPWQLRQWSDKMIAAGKKDFAVTLHIRRHRLEAGDQYEHPKIEIPWDHGWRFDRVAPYSPDAPMPIPELGLAYQIKTTVAAAKDGSPLKKDDVILNLRYDAEGVKEDIKGKWMGENLEPGQWANVSALIFQAPFTLKKLTYKIKRDEKEMEIDIPFEEDKTSPIADRGWWLTKDTRRVKADTAWGAVVMGFTDTKNRMTEVFQNLRGMVKGRLSVKNFGGPITIAAATYRFAGMDFAEFVFFLGLISINLAVVNFLPIPVLDGGHMVFLIYEKLRGQPASEGIRTAATIVGLAMIAALMIFVSYLDVMRHFFS